MATFSRARARACEGARIPRAYKGISCIITFAQIMGLAWTKQSYLPRRQVNNCHGSRRPKRKSWRFAPRRAENMLAHYCSTAHSFAPANEAHSFAPTKYAHESSPLFRAH